MPLDTCAQESPGTVTFFSVNFFFEDEYLLICKCVPGSIRVKSHGMTLMSGCNRNNAVGKDVLCVVVFEACTPNWVHPKSFI